MLQCAFSYVYQYNDATLQYACVFQTGAFLEAFPAAVLRALPLGRHEHHPVSDPNLSAFVFKCLARLLHCLHSNIVTKVLKPSFECRQCRQCLGPKEADNCAVAGQDLPAGAVGGGLRQRTELALLPPRSRRAPPT